MAPAENCKLFYDEINGLESYNTILNTITPIPCQSLLAKYEGKDFLVHLDSGATVSFIKLETALSLHLKIKPNGQLALLADEITRMQSLGEIDIVIVTNGKIFLRLRALVVKRLQVGCYGGTTFHVDNGVTADMTSGKISLHHGKFEVDQYNKVKPGGPIAHPPPVLTTEDCGQSVISDKSVDFSSIVTKDDLKQQFKLLREEISAPKRSTAVDTFEDVNNVKLNDIANCSTVHVMVKKNLLPGGVYKIKLNSAQVKEEYIAVIPQFNRLDHPGPEWRPQICKIENGHALYENNSDKILFHPKGVQLYIFTLCLLWKCQTKTCLKKCHQGI